MTDEPPYVCDACGGEFKTPQGRGLHQSKICYHASRGLKAIQLQAFLGWEEIDTARRYVKLTGEHTARALRNIHNR